MQAAAFRNGVAEDHVEQETANMSLDITVGILAELEPDGESWAYFMSEFDKINRLLCLHGLPEHHEPPRLPKERPGWGWNMFYSSIHHLRRFAAHVYACNALPEPIQEDASQDAVLRRYPERFRSCRPEGWLGKLLWRRSGGFSAGRFDHLILHSDGDGYYIPVPFAEVILDDQRLDLTGQMLGSSQALMAECERLADLLKLSLELDPDSEEVWAACDSPGGDTLWKEYGVESFVCLTLYHACRKSIEAGAAIVFH